MQKDKPVNHKQVDNLTKMLGYLLFMPRSSMGAEPYPFYARQYKKLPPTFQVSLPHQLRPSRHSTVDPNLRQI